ncbi:MAG: hypothetical protein Fur0037_25360 [Planctomycetota bacterium]
MTGGGRERAPLVWAIGCLCIAAGLAAIPSGTRTGKASSLPEVSLSLDSRAFPTWFGASRGASARAFACEVLDERGVPFRGKAEPRGFSRWHRESNKPALRVKAGHVPYGPREFELTRPEDALALGNWLPDRIAESLGLVTAANEHVALSIDGRPFGVYLRTLRPGPDLSARFRCEGTFFKGDAIGSRVAEDLWADASAWRSYGLSEAEALIALADLLDLLRGPRTAEALKELELRLDPERSAAKAAVLALSGSIHEDRIHNHMLLFRRDRGRIEPLPWDCNSFGTHARPDVPVDVARHPLAETLLCDPRWVHRRNEILWRILRGVGSAASLERQADMVLERIGPALKRDPGLGRLRFGDHGFDFVSANPEEIARYRRAFGSWVRERERHLLAWFDDARVFVADDENMPGGSVATVFGSVAVEVSRRQGGPLGEGLGARELLLPGLAEHLEEAVQYAGREPLVARFAPPAALAYEIPCPREMLVFRNAHTGAEVTPTDSAPRGASTRSIHPWILEPPRRRETRLGPGEVRIDETLVVRSMGRLVVEPGTTIRLAPGRGILCLGACDLRGEADAPIRIVAGESGGLAVLDRGACSIRGVESIGGGPWRHASLRFDGQIVLFDRKDALIEGLRGSGSRGAGIVLDHAAVRGRDIQVRDCRGAGIVLREAAFRAAGIGIRSCGEQGIRGRHCESDLEGVSIRNARGEGILLEDHSLARIRRAEIAVCLAGVACNDGSDAVVEDSVIRLAGTGWVARRSARFERAGRGRLARCRFEDIAAARADLDPTAVLEVSRAASARRPGAEARAQEVLDR